MKSIDDILTAFELHSPETIRECFAEGIDPNATYAGKPLVYSLINMYTRGPRFRECINVFVDAGLQFDDSILLAVLANDPTSLSELILRDSSLIHNRYSFDCTFTPLTEASLLHICAEYNHVDCAKILIAAGLSIDAQAGYDEYGFGGQTPIFHTVNQHANTCMDMLNLLLAHGADLELTVKGLIWGRGYSWETFIPSVNPVSYAMMGLLRQFQRTEKQIYHVVSMLIMSKYGINYLPANIPNAYLAGQ